LLHICVACHTQQKAVSMNRDQFSPKKNYIQKYKTIKPQPREELLQPLRMNYERSIFNLACLTLLLRCPFDFYAFYTHIFPGELCSWTGVMIFGFAPWLSASVSASRATLVDKFLAWGNLCAFTSSGISFRIGCPLCLPQLPLLHQPGDVHILRIRLLWQSNHFDLTF